MHLASVLDQYHDALQAKYGAQLLPGHLRAIDAIGRCRTPAAGELFVQCPGCGHATWKPHSCGHRSCPQCQNHEASVWLSTHLKVTWPSWLETILFSEMTPRYKYRARYFKAGWPFPAWVQSTTHLTGNGLGTHSADFFNASRNRARNTLARANSLNW